MSFDGASRACLILYENFHSIRLYTSVGAFIVSICQSALHFIFTDARKDFFCLKVKIVQSMLCIFMGCCVLWNIELTDLSISNQDSFFIRDQIIPVLWKTPFNRLHSYSQPNSLIRSCGPDVRKFPEFTFLKRIVPQPWFFFKILSWTEYHFVTCAGHHGLGRERPRCLLHLRRGGCLQIPAQA